MYTDTNLNKGYKIESFFACEVSLLPRFFCGESSNCGTRLPRGGGGGFLYDSENTGQLADSTAQHHQV
jgi:hypothetical protein